mgnify:CR=1 FL=1
MEGSTPAVTGAMSTVVSALTNSTTGLTASTMFGVVADLVPFIVTDKSLTLKDGKLGDIAPTMLTVMELDVPKEMTGNVLVK